MNILVTGALGFIGSNLSGRLLTLGHKVVGVDNLSNPSIAPTDRIKAESKLNWENFKFYDFDISKNKLNSIVMNEGIDLIIHLAASGSVPKSFQKPEEYLLNNELGFLNMLKLTTLTKQGKLIYASSSSVYGSSVDDVKIENSVGVPLSPYALSKVQNELYAKYFSDILNIKTIGLRFFNVYGKGQRHDSAYSAVIPKFVSGSTLSVNGDGTCIRDFTHVDDIVDCILLAIQDDKIKCDVFNVCTGIGTTIKDLAEICAQGIKKIIYKEPRAFDVKISIGSYEKAKKALGYEPKRNLKTEIENLLSGT